MEYVCIYVNKTILIKFISIIYLLKIFYKNIILLRKNNLILEYVKILNLVM